MLSHICSSFITFMWFSTVYKEDIYLYINIHAVFLCPTLVCEKKGNSVCVNESACVCACVCACLCVLVWGLPCLRMCMCEFQVGVHVCVGELICFYSLSSSWQRSQTECDVMFGMWAEWRLSVIAVRVGLAGPAIHLLEMYYLNTSAINTPGELWSCTTISIRF